MNILNNLEKLNPACFIYENWESNWWNLLDIEYADTVNIKIVMNAVEKYAIGYCESDKVELRPKEDSYAVMFEKDGERFWFHVQKWEFEYIEEEFE